MTNIGSKNKSLWQLASMLSVCFFLTFDSFAQQITPNNKVSVFRPEILERNLLTDGQIERLKQSGDWGQKDNNNNNPGFWVVYSDRDNNKLYKNATDDTPFTDNRNRDQTLSFNEKVYIAEINYNTNRAHVFTATKQNNKWPIISTIGATDKGWIPMDHLLLWQQCPANDRGILHKALFLTDYDDYSNKDYDPYRYKNPETQEGKIELSYDMNFYFIMKDELINGKHWYLLATAPKLESNGSSEYQLYGWVTKGNFIAWEQRECLEPVFAPSMLKEIYGTNDIKESKIPIVGVKAKISTYLPLGKVTTSVSSDYYKYRLNGKFLRMPLIDKPLVNTPDKYPVAAFATSGGQTYIPEKPGDFIDVNDIRKEANEHINQINIIFVIDGTNSMQPYFASAVESINKAKANFQLEDVVVKIAAVIYRNKKDGQYETEYRSLIDINRSSELSSWLAKGGDYGVKSAERIVEHESLYAGLELALDKDKIGFQREASNIMLVIGDCGNLADPSKQKQIIAKTWENNVNISFFQVKYEGSDPWRDFRNQMNDIVRFSVMSKLVMKIITSQEEYAPYVKEKIIDARPGLGGTETIWKRNESGSKYSDFYFGEGRYTQEGKSMNKEELTALIENNFVKQAASLETRRRFVGQLSSEVKNSTSSIDISQLQGVVSKERIEEWKQSGVFLCFEARVDKQKNNVDQWIPVVMLSRDELQKLLETFRKLDDLAVVKDTINREPFINAMKELAQQMTGNGNIGDLTAGQIMNMARGLHVQTKMQRDEGFNLKDMGTSDGMPNRTYRKYLENFHDRYQDLRRLQSGSAFTKQIGDTDFYWILVDQLP